MYIKKITEGSGIPDNAVLDGYSESQTDAYSCNYINKLHTYSTEERVIGIWIDGRPIYGKVVQIGACSLSTNVSWFDTNITDIDTIVDFEFRFKYVSGNSTIWYKNWNLKELGYNITTKKLGVATSASANFSDSFAILGYTKTTDIATIELDAINTMSLDIENSRVGGE